MIYNGVDLTDYFKILDRTRNFAPAAEIFTSENRRTDGARYLGSRYQSNSVNVKIELEETDRASIMDLVEEINTFLYTTKPEKLILLDDPDRYYLAKYESSSVIDRYGHFGVVELTFAIPYPYRFSAQELVFEDIHNRVLYNSGIRDVWGIITIEVRSDVSDIKITLENTQEYIKLLGTFRRGDIITINLQTERAYKNGNYFVRDIDYNSDFFSIPKGSFKIKLSSGKASLAFREEWL